MTRHSDNSRTALLKVEEATRIEIASLGCRLVAARNKLEAVQRTLDARAPGWRDGAETLVRA